MREWRAAENNGRNKPLTLVIPDSQFEVDLPEWRNW